MGLVTVHGRSWKRPPKTNLDPTQLSGGVIFALLADPQLGFLRNSSTDYNEELMRLNTARVDLQKNSAQFVIVLGDLVQVLPNDNKKEGERAAQTGKIYDALRSFPAHIPVFVLCGNHDVGNAPTEETLRLYRELWGDDYYAFDVEQARFIILNSSVFYDSTNVPAYAEEQLGWLEMQLQDAVDQKKTPLLFMHHPLYWDNWDEPDDLGLLHIRALKTESPKGYFHLPRKWRDPLRALVRRYNVRYSFHGHLHDNRVVTAEDPVFEEVITSAIGFPLGQAGAGYRIVTMKEGNTHVEHRFIELFPNSLENAEKEELVETGERQICGSGEKETN